MRALPLLAVVATAAALTFLDPENWFGDSAPLVAVMCVAAALVAFNWWELWSTRDGSAPRSRR
jgi:hypothetical protein